MYKLKIPFLSVPAAVIAGFISNWSIPIILFSAGLFEILSIIYVVFKVAFGQSGFRYPQSVGGWILSQYSFKEGGDANVYDMLYSCGERLIGYYAFILGWFILAVPLLILSLLHITKPSK